MPLRTPRPVTPRRWRALTITGAAVTLATTSPVVADQIDFGKPDARIWFAQTEGGEGGEGGESGAVAEPSGAEEGAGFLTALSADRRAPPGRLCALCREQGRSGGHAHEAPQG